MNNKIESKWYINNEDRVWIRYYVDENAIIWYNYKDLFETLYLSGRKALGMYKDLSEEYTHIFFDLNNDNNKNNFYETPFITVEGIYEIEERNNERFKLLYKNIHVIKQEAVLTDNYRTKTNKDNLKELICDAIDNDALEEFTIDESKINYTLEYNENDIMVKKPINENNSVKYKKIKNSSCPSWLRSVVN